MNILFVTFGELSIGGGNTRPVSVLRALADAGHQVDVVASRAKIPDHPYITLLAGDGDQSISEHRIRIEVLRATGRSSYDVVHAVDDAVPFVFWLCRLRRVKLVYDASRCFTGSVGIAPSLLWKWFPGYFCRLEKKILQQAAAILTPCQVLSEDLKGIDSDVKIVQVEDVPVQSLFSGREIDRSSLLNRFEGHSSFIVVCSILPGNRTELRKLLVAARKVVESIPHVAFFFKGDLVSEAAAMAANLDIQSRCLFLETNETEDFLSALDIADAALLVSQSGDRYVHPEVFTLLRSPPPLVVVQDGAYDKLLTEENSVQALPSPDSIAEGLLRVIQEPLFSIGIAAEGQQLIADNYSLSSFKHKIRMAYHEVLNKN